MGIYTITSTSSQTAYPGFTGVLNVADGGVGNPIFRINLHTEDNIKTAQ